ncbi:hypothetical protein HYT91_03185 [Candidatus Pacearchaeota archaeon]|nr:hypothetical protein [Candidatus Pacearchaeota archaeon]
MFSHLTKKEIKLLKKLNSPKKIQDYLNSLKINFEKEGDTCFSPRKVLEEQKCHCIEGAVLAAMILRFHGHEPLVVDLTSSKKDFDHVIAVFKKYGKWGAISKTNHPVLRYREPVYNSIRELVMSFFHEYFLDNGKKTLRSYTKPINLSIFDKKGWMLLPEEIWYIAEHLAEIKHIPILNRKQIANLRKADKIEIEVGKITEWKNQKS